VAIAGLVRNRKHQFGRQASLNTPIAAKRVYPFKGTPASADVWVDPDVDVGSIFPSEAPYRGPANFTAALTDPSLRYNTIPLLMCALFGGAETPAGAGTAKTWSHAPDASVPWTTDAFTYEFGDDVTTDWMQFGDGILETLEITGPVGLGAISTSMTWQFGSMFGSGFTDFSASPAVPTALDLVSNEAVVYLKDMGIYIASDFGDLESTQITDALHNFTLRITKSVDNKRYANGDQSFDIDEYGVTGVTVELEAHFAKTSDIVGTGSESDAWFSEQAVDRYIRLFFESKVEAETAIPYSWDLQMPARYYTRAEGEQGGNTTVVLNAHAFFEPDDFEGAFTSEAVTSLASSGL
jgi:hypothetical protein